MDIFAGFTVLQLAAALTTGLVAAFIRGLAGFGLAIILVPVLALALTPVEAVLTTNVVALLIGGLELPRLLREAERAHDGDFSAAVAHRIVDADHHANSCNNDN